MTSINLTDKTIQVIVNRGRIEEWKLLFIEWLDKHPQFEFYITYREEFRSKSIFQRYFLKIDEMFFLRRKRRFTSLTNPDRKLLDYKNREAQEPDIVIDLFGIDNPGQKYKLAIQPSIVKRNYLFKAQYYYTDLKNGLSHIEILIFKNRNPQLLICSDTTTDHLSLLRTYEKCCSKTISMLEWSLEHLHEIKGSENRADASTRNNQNSKKLWKSVFAHALGYIKMRIKRKLNPENWNIYVATGKDQDFANLNLNAFRHIVKPKGEDWADPFMVQFNEQDYLFFERVPRDSNKGVISVGKLEGSGLLTGLQDVLIKSYHLAYPFVFEFEGSYYMIPDSGQNHSVDLYKCTTFPFNWEHVKTLLHGGHFVDSTLLFVHNRWWLFCNITRGEGQSSFDDLFLFYNDNLLDGEWTPHRLNPVVSGASSARPAGRIFKSGNRIFRPSQFSAHRYGFGLNINEIVALNENEYNEKLVKRYLPWKRSVSACHTLDFNEDWVVIDAKGY